MEVGQLLSVIDAPSFEGVDLLLLVLPKMSKVKSVCNGRRRLQIGLAYGRHKKVMVNVMWSENQPSAGRSVPNVQDVGTEARGGSGGI